MELLVDLLSWFCLMAGVALAIIAGIGLIRLPDLFARMHAAGIGDTLAVLLIILGMMLQTGWTLNLAKLVLILFFIFFTSPASTHALAKAALHGGVQPLLKPNKDDTPSKT